MLSLKGKSGILGNDGLLKAFLDTPGGPIEPFEPYAS